MNPSLRESATHRFDISTTYEAGLQEQVTILVVSANLESRRQVSNILEALSVQVIPCSTVGPNRTTTLASTPKSHLLR